MAALGKLDRVRHQVQHHLADAPGVTQKMAVCARGIPKQQFHSPLLCPGRHQIHYALQGAVQVKRHWLQQQLAGFHLGEVQNIVDDGEQRVGGLPNRLGIAPLLRRQCRARQQRGHAADAVHRGPDFMAHRGKKLALDESGGLGALLLHQQLPDALPNPFGGFFELADVADHRAADQPARGIGGQDRFQVDPKRAEVLPHQP